MEREIHEILAKYGLVFTCESLPALLLSGHFTRQWCWEEKGGCKGWWDRQTTFGPLESCYEHFSMGNSTRPSLYRSASFSQSGSLKGRVVASYDCRSKWNHQRLGLRVFLFWLCWRLPACESFGCLVGDDWWAFDIGDTTFASCLRAIYLHRWIAHRWMFPIYTRPGTNLFEDDCDNFRMKCWLEHTYIVATSFMKRKVTC